MARRAPAPPSRPVVAMCSWEDYDYRYDRKPGEPFWVPDGDEPTACRASLGAHKLTVWLPKGARIVCRVPWPHDGFDPMAHTFNHVYGSHERCSRTRIRIRLTHLPDPATTVTESDRLGIEPR